MPGTAKAAVLEERWLTIAETMEALGIAKRTVQDWASQGLLHWKLQIGEGKRERVYDARDVEKLRNDGPPPRTPSSRPERAPSAEARTAIAPRVRAMPLPSEEWMQAFREMMQPIFAQRQLPAPAPEAPKATVPAVRLKEKLWLSLSEAKAYSGLSRSDLLVLAHDGRVKARKSGGWKFLRKSLEEFEG